MVGRKITHLIFAFFCHPIFLPMPHLGRGAMPASGGEDTGGLLLATPPELVLDCEHKGFQ